VIAVSAQDFESWRHLARKLLRAGILPNELHWSSETPSLFEGTNPRAPARNIQVPRTFLELGRTVALHRDGRRWSLLYRILYRIENGERNLLEIDIDEDVRRVRLMERAVRRDMHKMKAFVRFRLVADSDPEEYVAWHRPDHRIVDAMGPWFTARFGSMRWSILTPERSAHWDLHELSYGPGIPRSEAPQGDALEALWKDYYGSIFNPARVKVKAMKAEMPVRHWATLPETQIIPNLLAAADERVMEMVTRQKTSAIPWVPATHELARLRAAAPGCKGCDLYQHATQVVFGEGPPDSKVVMVGEQPGDEEDIQGHPFVGPAGRLLNKAMHEAELDREKIYVTNAVKHFKFTLERGKRRIHSKPSGMQISACKPWLEAELDAIKPDLVVCLGATAAQALMGRDFRITAHRGEFYPHDRAKEMVATIHPSAILRAQERYAEEYELFVRDLRRIATRVRELEKAAS
jgi:uracil-DNA glycosylase